MNLGPANQQRGGRAARETELLREIAERAGLGSVGMVAWRDIDDDEAGGSELHAHEIARRWAACGIDVVLRTSGVAGGPRTLVRDRYRAVRADGRYAVFTHAPLEIAAGRFGPIGKLDGLVEIWNGMPFLSPLWWRGPRIVFLHHVHAEMWRMVLPPRLAQAGNLLESRLAPPIYRKTRIVTLSHSSRQEIVQSLGMKPELVSVVPPGIDARFSREGPREGPSPVGARSPGTAVKSSHPLVVAVGRLVPVKQFHRLIAAAGPLQALHRDLEVVIVGEGYERPALEAAIATAGLSDVVRLTGRLSDDQLVDLYRRAWVLASTSVREGWGMTVTEAAACGTPSVASRIAGHVDAVEDDVSGVLFDNDDQLVKMLDRVLSDAAFRDRLSAGALKKARDLTWDATALGTLEVLAAETQRHLAHSRRTARRR